jgi:hypothetical protein
VDLEALAVLNFLFFLIIVRKKFKHQKSAKNLDRLVLLVRLGWVPRVAHAGRGRLLDPGVLFLLWVLTVHVALANPEGRRSRNGLESQPRPDHRALNFHE